MSMGVGRKVKSKVKIETLPVGAQFIVTAWREKGYMRDGDNTLIYSAKSLDSGEDGRPVGVYWRCFDWHKDAIEAEFFETFNCERGC